MLRVLVRLWAYCFFLCCIIFWFCFSILSYFPLYGLFPLILTAGSLQPRVVLAINVFLVTVVTLALFPCTMYAFSIEI